MDWTSYMNSEHTRCVDIPPCIHESFQPHPLLPKLWKNDGTCFPPTLSIFQPCNRLAWVWQTPWQRLNGKECLLCRYLNCARAVEIAGTAWTMSFFLINIWEFNILLKNRSSADPHIEGGKDRGGEKNGVTVMVSCLLLVSRPDLFWKN